MSKIKEHDAEKFFEDNQVNINDIESDLFTVVGEKSSENEHIASKPYSYWKSVGKLLIKSKVFMISAVILLAFIILMFVVPAGKELYQKVDTTNMSATPEHPFGLGTLGEDFWVEIWAGMKTTLLFAFLITIIQLVIGIVLGSIWGYFRKTDIFFIQLTNLLTIVPQLILLLFVIFLLKPGYWPVVLGVTLQSWITMAATIRVQIMLVKNTDYNTASTSLGTKSNKIIRKNILPKILPVIVQQGTFAIPMAISIDATLSFLNFGYIDESSQTQTSLGVILNRIMSGSDWQQSPRLLIIPVVLITAVSVIFFLFGKVLADSLDPKNHR